ncbi:M20/M25/M40 family metallo-hydrolase [Agromyces archimandritae]|uniref:M20/M25/M40 family metallo-hydrolase n=1 Tax=Agromyces archimandritae TaxID=2781962 RepID=A0A975IMN9_9MICO|nr:M20/M25/M40 family metallo-hydrolase [Agromyces archimandritae]QTX03713.1 M20/M25/M40 family metallo-hydrolase [Agromyces archimandritae]
MTDAAELMQKLDALMPDVLDRHAKLVRIPSIAFPGFDEKPVHEMGQAVVDMLRDAGAADAELLAVPDGYPCVYADIPGPEGSPTVLLYAHYDVQPAPKEQGWTSDPWEPTKKADGRIYGRGAADDKSGLAMHYGTLKLLAANPPCRIKILVEGEEETISHLEPFVEANPERFACDVAVIADIGPQAVNRPGLTTALRGDVSCTITVSTLANPVHSGLFGGAAPDAMTAMIRILAGLHDDAGDTVIPGVDSGTWPGAAMDEPVYRAGSAILDGVDYLGTGSLSDRIWAKPSVTVIGMDVPNTVEGSNVLLPSVKARLSLRIAPGSDADAQLDALMSHLRAQTPWNCKVEVEKVKTGHAFAVDTSASAIKAAEDALSEVYGKNVEAIGSGGSIPLVASIQKVAPKAAIVLWGVQDTEHARIHASDESVDPAELQRMTAAQALLLTKLGA